MWLVAVWLVAVSLVAAYGFLVYGDAKMTQDGLLDVPVRVLCVPRDRVVAKLETVDQGSTTNKYH